ncbi:unnamed protein product [Toxocara canis]|uniref:Late endosomal/lysosomal adaptor and MAPK and MTOR activator 5 n=1 Tax=Toxocara canis TaxID=6265 RepID=A0A183TW48_TOXCA|nr:unnamed protein product [Toxocara canis]
MECGGIAGPSRSQSTVSSSSKQTNCEVEMKARPRHIICYSSKGILRVLMESKWLCRRMRRQPVNRSVKHVCVNQPGMVASVGGYISSMDHFGHIISSP